ncbi:hypothetical protein RN001_003999 [Aquatica leii]|uniref:Uncharacterized protein n=1 Tax=Aquatica leii TaxID=1421715 RepID=A0AAN7SRS6_9COLE|nr:hypothetical protein RN001_003999 [Aquatica leii]
MKEIDSGENSRGPKRTKVSPYAGIIPFLRTGRSHSHLPYMEYESLDEPIKRAKSGRTIMAFPRVGRSETIEWTQDGQLSGVQRKNDVGGNNGLWFGPRLGRLQKRHYDDLSPSINAYSEYTPRLGRESEEVLQNIEGASDDDDVDLNKSI